MMFKIGRFPCKRLSCETPRTEGGRTDKNAHPHMDFDNRIALVHNGTINNAMELRKELQDMGVEFRSETDSEVGGDEISQVEVEVEVEPIPTQ